MSLTPEWFTPTSEEGKDAPQKFKVRGLDSMEALDISANMRQDGAFLKPNAEAFRAAVTRGLLDWENVCDADGNEIEFNKKHLRLISAFKLQEIGWQIINKSNLTDDEIKNS